MRILHYSLGIPPYRSGGLTKYSCDLMEQQASEGDEVFLLFPGVMKFTNKNVNINFYKKHNKVNVYELINPLPVPLLNGIASPKEFMKKCDKAIFVEFLKTIKIDIVHIHTFMGLYIEFLEACNELSIKVTYTTHDYFGLCTKVNFVSYEGTLCSNIDINKCAMCNSYGYSMKVINILQSKPYRWFKNNGGIDKLKKIKSKIKPKVESNKNVQSSEIQHINNETIVDYKCLKEYYKEMFSKVDLFLFNSSLTKEVYKKYLDCDGEIVSITHSDIKDNRQKKEYKDKQFKITYLGPDKEYKGFFLLRDAMKEIQNRGYKDIILNTYGDIGGNNYGENILIHGKYTYNQLQKIFENTDILIVPSIWNETFGFITLEALSYGVPVIASSTVGSKDLITAGNNKGIIIEPTREELVETILKIFNNRNLLKKFNDNILNEKFNYTIDKHSEVVKSLYEKIVKR